MKHRFQQAAMTARPSRILALLISIPQQMLIPRLLIQLGEVCTSHLDFTTTTEKMRELLLLHFSS
jgi:hypothetical protein